MTVNRRGFLAGILALGVAPAVVRASSIMRVRPIVLPGDPEWAMAQRWFTLDEVRARFLDAAYRQEARARWAEWLVREVDRCNAAMMYDERIVLRIAP